MSEDILQMAMRKITDESLVDDLWRGHNKLKTQLHLEEDPYKADDLLEKLRFLNSELQSRVKNLEYKYKLKLEAESLERFEHTLYARKARLDITEQYIKRLRKEMGRRFNEILGVSGRQGIGKSYFALALAKILDETFTVDRVAFTTQEFVQCVKKTKPKQYILWDEIGVPMDARISMEKTRRPVYQMLETFRVLQRNIIFTTPSVEFADKNIRRLYHYHLIMLDWGEAQVYEEDMIAKREIALGMVKMPLPPQDLVYCSKCKLAEGTDCPYDDIDCYEKRKFPYIMRLVELAGGIAPSPPNPLVTESKAPAPIPSATIEKLKKELGT